MTELQAVLTLVGIIAVAAFFHFAPSTEKSASRGRQPRRAQPVSRPPRRPVPVKPVPDTAKSVAASTPPKTRGKIEEDALTGCTVSTTGVMSREQAHVYSRITPYARDRGLILLAEVSLSAILSVHHSQDGKRAFAGFARIRQKRVDFLLTDRDFRPVCAIEYHGSGHWQGNARERDAVKRQAFAMAALPFLEISKGDDLAGIPALLDRTISGHRGREEPPIRRRA